MDKFDQREITVKENILQDRVMEILGKTEDLWKVRILFPPPLNSDKEVVEQMSQVKEMISQECGVASELLEFRELVEKIPTPDGIMATVIIGRMNVGQGKPVVRLRPKETPRGDLIQDMIAEIDFYYLDEFDQPISLKRILLELEKKKVNLDLVDHTTLEESLSRVLEKKSFVKRLEVARGKLPSFGQDAELEYTFFADPTAANNLAEYRMGRKVKERDVICQKIPPQDGKEFGCDVRGQVIPPIKGIDFQIVAGEGTKLSIDENSVTALRDGVPVISREMKQIYTLAGIRVVPDKITVCVKRLIEMNAEDIIKIVVEDSVEVIGDLKSGSTITTAGELFMDGDVENGTNLSAGDNVLIDGNIKGGEINSENSIFVSKEAGDATLIAVDNIIIQGTVRNSILSGCKVAVGDVQGSTIEAGQKLSMEIVGNDKKRHKSTIRVGRDDFYKRKLEAGREIVNNLKANLEHIKILFGDEVFERLSTSNHQQLLIGFIKELHKRGFNEMDENTVDSLKQLLQTINPLKDVIIEKTEEIEYLKRKATDESAHKPVIVVRGKILDPTNVTIKDKTDTIGPTLKGTAITRGAYGNIKTFELPQPKKNRPPADITETMKKRKSR